MALQEGPKRIRAIERGLSVIEHLSNHGLSTLAELRHATGLSNATLLRVLVTLQDRGWVRRNIVEGQYELAHSLGSVLGVNARAHPLAEIAAPYLLQMRTRELGIPSDLCALIAPGKVEIVESTRLRGPLAPWRTGLGLRPSMIRSAHGRAILASATAKDYEFHLQAALNLDFRADRRWLESNDLNAILEETRCQGFGLREDNYYIDADFDPLHNTGALAVPVISQTGIHGSLSLMWLKDDTNLDEVLALGSLEDLRTTASRIGEAMDRNGISAPAFAENT